jgi:hypothetical protein
MCFKAALHDRQQRLLTRHFHEDALYRMNARIEADPDLMRQRRCAAEHPFGTVKRMTASGGRFLTRGITKVKAECALSILAYSTCAQDLSVRASGKTRLTKKRGSQLTGASLFRTACLATLLLFGLHPVWMTRS